MKMGLLNVRFAALLTLAAVSTGLLAVQSARAAERKVLLENFTMLG